MTTLKVNGKTFEVIADDDTPLLYVLRNELRLTGPKFGCGLGQCGSCKVLIGDDAQYSCLFPLGALKGKEITTIEGLGSEQMGWDPVQEAFIKEQAAQCGYCTGGMIISAVSLLRRSKNPTDGEIVEAMDGNLCRCGTQFRVMKAIKACRT